MKKIYTSIDLGSDTIKFIVGEYFNDKVNILANLSLPSKGLKRGLIIDANEVITIIKEGIKQLSSNLGISLSKCIVNVPSYNAHYLYVNSSLKLSTGRVETEDILNVIKQSVYSKLEQKYELVTVLPLDFIIDNKKNNPYPALKNGKKLEFKGIMISVPEKNVYSVLSVIEACELEVVDITINGINDFYEVKNDSFSNKIGAVINIGYETTTISIINKCKFMNSETITLGGKNIDKDLSSIFNIDLSLSRKIKEKFATAHKRFTQLNDTFPIKTNNGETLKLNQLEVSEVVMARLEEILNLAQKEINNLTKQNVNYIILTGGTSEIRYFKNLCFEILGKDVIIYSVDTLGVRESKYTDALGMIKYFHSKMKIRNIDYSMISGEDESLLITPKNKKKNKDGKIGKLFGNLLNNDKEDK